MMKPRKPTKDRFKTAELAKIHIAKKQLDMDEDTYRAMLQSVAGVRSSKDLSALGRAQVLEHLKKVGFTGPKTYPGRPNNIDSEASRAKLLKKIEALLADAGRAWSYALSMARHMYKKEALEFCDSTELTGLIAALVKDQRKQQTKG